MVVSVADVVAVAVVAMRATLAAKRAIDRTSAPKDPVVAEAGEEEGVEVSLFLSLCLSLCLSLASLFLRAPRSLSLSFVGGVVGCPVHLSFLQVVVVVVVVVVAASSVVRKDTNLSIAHKAAVAVAAAATGHASSAARKATNRSNARREAAVAVGVVVEVAAAEAEVGAVAEGVVRGRNS